MKKLFFTFIAFFVVIADAEQLSVTNGRVTIAFSDGVVQIIAPGIEKPVATITAGIENATLKVSTVSHPKRNFKLLSLRGPDGSIAFKLEDDNARFIVTHNCGASPITVRWNAAAVVVPDVFAEDEVLLPGKKVRSLPPFVPLYLALLGDGDATLACIPVKAKSPAALSADLKTLTLSSKNNEDYIFVLNTGNGAWHRTALPAEPGEFKTLSDWTPPYHAVWRAAFPVAEDFIPSGNDSWSTWNIVTVLGKERPKNLIERGNMVDHKTRRTWNDGFEGFYRYPAEFLDGKLKLMHPQFKCKVVHDRTRPVFVYAWRREPETKTAMPEDFLPPWVSGNRLCKSTNTNFGMNGTTCYVSMRFEKIFYRDEADKKVDEIDAMLKSMQCFVESIRGRIENGREWREEMLKFSADMRKLHPFLAPDADKRDAAVNEIDKQYQIDRERIKTPPEVEKLGREVLKLAVSKLDADEKEEKAKQLGRAIRAIGGAQDCMIAKFRHVGKCVRHTALAEYMAAKTPEALEFWKETYRRTEQLLQGFYWHEGK